MAPSFITVTATAPAAAAFVATPLSFRTFFLTSPLPARPPTLRTSRASRPSGPTPRSAPATATTTSPPPPLPQSRPVAAPLSPVSADVAVPAPPLASPSPSASPSPLLPALQQAIPYFAYFANMNPNKFGPTARIPLRRCRPLRSAPAFLPAHRLVFNVPGLPPEPAFANLAADSDPTAAVHGVLHWLHPLDFARVARSEGLAPPDSPLADLPSALRLGDVRRVRVHVCVDDQVVAVDARTFFFFDRAATLVPPPLRRLMRPSRRYVQVAVDGAEYWGLDKAYVEGVLKRVRMARGAWGGFGLAVEPRPHLLDRPNPNERFGNVSSEMYSPWSPIGATEAVRVMEKEEEKDKEGRVEGKEIRLLRLSTGERGGKRPLYFVPGIDGTGKSVLSQVEALDAQGVYDVSAIVYPFANRQSIAEIANSIIDLLAHDAGGNPVSIMGESMGGAVSVVLAKENMRRKREEGSGAEKVLDIDLLLLLNPATSYKRSRARTLWSFLLQLGFSEEQYATLLPPVLLPFVVDLDAARSSFGPSLIPRFRKMLTSLSHLSDALPQDALLHRTKLLSNFSMTGKELAELASDHGPNNVAVISTVNDNLVPSLSELYRFQRHVPGLYSMVLPYGGHAPMFDTRFSLAHFLKPFAHNTDTGKQEKGAAVDVEGGASSEKLLKRRAALRKKFSSNLASQKAIDNKSWQDIGRLREFLKDWLQRSAPVFVGEENLPLPAPGKPVLFIGNHTLLGWLDAMVPSYRLLTTKGIVVRPLAHPRLFGAASFNFPGTTKFGAEDLEKFGVVRVSPRNLLEQLSNDHWTMLFPGGAREALKKPSDEKHSLHWPEDPEFIRACALLGATVIPLATVGTEDMVKVLLDSNRVADLIDRGSRFIGRPIDTSNKLQDNARDWKTSSKEDPTVVVPPLMVPAGDDRIYYRFGKPIEIPSACLDDPVMEKKLYQQVKRQLKEGIDILTKRREADVYRSTENRKEFVEQYGDLIDPPAGPAWSWTRGPGAYLDEEFQPPL